LQFESIHNLSNLYRLFLIQLFYDFTYGGTGMPPRRKVKKLSSLRSTRSESQFKRLIKRFDHRPVIISEGDSWFAHPLRRNTIKCIENMGRFNLLRLESIGDEVVKIMSANQKKKLKNILEWHPVELILFSGGGE